jgi:hypothetical protein
MAAFLTCGNGRITLLKNSCPSGAAAAGAAASAAPALLTYYLLSGFSYH